MIRIFIGNPGSGKTLCAVRELALNPTRETFTNIRTSGMRHVHMVNREMFVKKEIVKTIKGKDGERAIYDLSFNQQFWTEKVKEVGTLDITIDEAHILFNARGSMSKTNKIMGDFLALSRKIMGGSDATGGRLTLITQIPRRLDIWCHEMARQIRYHRCHYVIYCACGFSQREDNDMPMPLECCPDCGSYSLKRRNHVIEVWFFVDSEKLAAWRELGRKTFFKHIMISDVERFFGRYETYQFDNLLSG